MAGALRLSETDLERLILAGDDISFLIDLPQTRLLTHTEVRLAASILRRLLIDGQLKAVTRSIAQVFKSRLIVEARDIDTALSTVPERWVTHAWAGGAGPSAAHHLGLIHYKVPAADHAAYASTEEFLAANPLAQMGASRDFTLDSWLGSTSVAIQTDELGLVKVSRRSVLKYIANRKGGVHFDPKRDLKLANARKRRAEVEHYLLDHGLLRLGHLSGAEFEIVSMAQAVASSGWAPEIVSIARQVAPEDFDGDPYEFKFFTGNVEADGTYWVTGRFEPTAEESGSSADS